MILLDYNQVFLSSIMIQLGPHPTIKLNNELANHMFFNSLAFYSKRFSNQYGNLVICCDSKKVWRKDIFEYYKVGRKKTRANSKFDWQTVYDILESMRNNLIEYFPYRVIEVPHAEADDIIGVICKYRHSIDEKILIVSGDKDLSQLQKYPNVFQYSPRTKKYIALDDPVKSLKEHIIRGDESDGIPNILSPDDTFVSGKRQAPIFLKRIIAWVEEEPDTFCNTGMERNYHRNQQLIDLNFTPQSIVDKTLEILDTTPSGNRQKMLNYLIHHKYSKILERVGDF